MLAAPRRSVLALVLVLLTLISGGCGRGDKPAGAIDGRASLSATTPSGALQEVAPPGAVQQLIERLNEWSPQVQVVAPLDNALIPAGAWELQLKVNNWPLADAAELGVGPHLVVQLDDQEPQRITSLEAAAAVAMPELRPGSHRVTVYAARPWGEAVKAPGALQQIRVHRVARNAAELPAPASAQLIAASPDGSPTSEPVLIDWLLLDAPLQNLRGDDARWRLRISVNGDSFLVDRQTPLWLKGFKRGSNAVQLELLDGRGDPLNPPFNSVVQEVVINAGSRPAWQRASLSASELALLSGEPQPETAATRPTPDEQADTPTASEPAIEPARASETPASSFPGDSQTSEVQENEPNANSAAEAEAEAPAVAPSEEREASQTEPSPAPAQAAASGETSPTTSEAPLEAPLTSPEPTSPEPSSPQPFTEAKPDSDPAATAPAASVPAATEQDLGPAPGPSPSEAPEQRLAPQSNLSGSARDLVNADGSLQQAAPRGPLAGLREKLGG